MTAGLATCPACGAGLGAGARFCEGCGAPLGTAAVPEEVPVAGEEAHPLGAAPISAPTRRPAGALPDPPEPGRRPCRDCGGEVGPDLYCLQCGTKAPSERDHFVEQPSSWVAGVCDRALRKTRNEDAMALLSGEVPGSRAVLVVLDGVSNSIDSDVASLAGARAARDVLRTPLPAGMGTPQSHDAAVARVMTTAVTAANTAIVAVTDPDSPNPASATLTAVVVEGRRITWANIGDSRSYWLPDAGPARQLSVDDSVAAIQIASGVAREVAEAGPQAHAITKWLGRDAEDIRPSVGSTDVEGSGWVLACSDGLWNYASTPEQLHEQVRALAGDAFSLAQGLVAFANGAGGHDNITVAVARIGEPVVRQTAGEDAPEAAAVPPTEVPAPLPPAPPAPAPPAPAPAPAPTLSTGGSTHG